MSANPRPIVTDDGISLEAELTRPPDDTPLRAGTVLCHPHPQFGGTMRSIVISALFGALPTAGIACLRFNFRGVEGSAGTHDSGDSERLDATAAIDALSDALPSGTPIVLAGWSFGADVALSVSDDRLAAWLAIACPLRFGHDIDVTAADPRPKLLLLAQHDEYRAPADVAAEVAHWTNTRVEIVGGASHFFVGVTDRVVRYAQDYIDGVVGAD